MQTVSNKRFPVFGLFVLPLAILFSACGGNSVLKENIKLEQYPSASGIEYLDGKYYIIGDDANYLLVLDSNFKPADSIPLYAYTEKRIPKSIKADLESIIITPDKKLVVFGSGSLIPYRNAALLVDPVTKQRDSVRLDVMYERLKENGLSELNIEGVASLPGSVVLVNRGSKGFPKNHLVFTKAAFWNQQAGAPVQIISLGGNTDTSQFKGVSGLAYCRKSDRLLLAVSTEDTRNSLDDGAIGKSYIWIIDNISSKRNWKAINPDQVIDLETIDPAFKSQKIESVCVIKETRNFLHLVLAADNDNGTSSIFKVIAEKK